MHRALRGACRGSASCLGLATVAVCTAETVPYLRYDTVPCGRIRALVRHGDGTVLTRIDRKNTAVNGQYGFPRPEPIILTNGLFWWKFGPRCARQSQVPVKKGPQGSRFRSKSSFRPHPTIFGWSPLGRPLWQVHNFVLYTFNSRTAGENAA